VTQIAPMNLLYTITAYPPSIGGAQACFHELARRLAHRHNVQVCAHWAQTRTDWLLGTTLLAPRDAVAYVLDGVPVHLLSPSTAERWEVLPLVLGYHLFQGAAIAGIARRILDHLEQAAGSPDLIHNGRIGREGLSFASWHLARRLGVPFVLTPFHHPRWSGWLHRHYLHLYRQADALIALTESERETLIGLGVEPQRIFVTGMGPVLAETADAESFRRCHSLQGPIILFLGQKYQYKGVAALLAATPTVWARFPDTTFLFVGPRTRYSRLLFAQHRDRRMVELDAVDLQTKTDALAACTVLCLPSTQESFGAVFLEAWLMGRPVIGGDSPAVRQVIDDGDDGYVVRQDPAAIAERIVYLLEHPEIGQEMAVRGQAKVQARYTWEHLARQTEAVYEAIL
jgi:glycosyltransferase involved in cell wall biosynthesis